MKMTGSQQIDAAPDVVWAAMFDTDILKISVPGCNEISGSAEDGMEATVVQKVGPVKATFKGKLTYSDIEANTSLRLSGEGKGGNAGFAKGGAAVRLEPAGNGTLLHYEVDAKVGGKLAQLGNRVIDGFAKKMADNFFTNLKAAIEPEPEIQEIAEEVLPPKSAFAILWGIITGFIRRLFGARP